MQVFSNPLHVVIKKELSYGVHELYKEGAQNVYDRDIMAQVVYSE
jgi:hypothetical protein